MELLCPYPPPQPTTNYFTGYSPPETLRFPQSSMFNSQLPEIREEVAEKVHVAVGKSLEKSAGLLSWAVQQFGDLEIGLVHVHQPSPTIPTLLGKLPATQANEDLVSAYRREEKEHTKKLLFNYLNICYKLKVQASIVIIENEQVQEGIIELVARHGIRKLVMGAAAESCMKMKRSSSKAYYMAKHAPQFCEICFVHKGNHVWTREASEGPNSRVQLNCEPETGLWKRLKPKLTNSSNSEPAFNSDCLGSSTSTTRRQNTVRNLATKEPEKREVVMSTPELHFTDGTDPLDSRSSKGSTSSASGLSSPSDRQFASDINMKEEKELEILKNRIIEARLEAERSKEEASAELLKRKRLESETMEAINKVKASEAAYAHEIGVRKETEDELKNTKEELQKLSDKRDETMQELQRTMRNLAILDSHAREAAHRRDEAAGELKLIQASVAALQHERKKITQQRDEALRRLDRWRCLGNARAHDCNVLIGFVNQSSEFTEFSLSDLQTATCNFSESFRVGQGGNGCVYKGEMLDRTVAIKKFHPYNMQGQREFQQEVQVLGKLKHPHLVTLIGACPEAWSLVYEYFPNGSLQDRLFHKTKAVPLTWKARIRIAAQISSALHFLHSSGPEKIVHGDLKPENILLDSDFNCKIGDFGISRLVSEENVDFPTFRRYTDPKGAFPYTAPEFQRTGQLTPKCDIYSFGIIILQLLTGRPPVGLASEVKRALLSGKLESVLDPLAGDWPKLAAGRLAELGSQCSEINSRDRLELTPAVVRELERLLIAEERPVPHFFLCPITQEIMHDPQLAADGFTYEGEALRRWLESGCQTSPMTNLKLKHLNLIPNHALRFAIQDWLCQF